MLFGLFDNTRMRREEKRHVEAMRREQIRYERKMAKFEGRHNRKEKKNQEWAEAWTASPEEWENWGITG